MEIDRKQGRGKRSEGEGRDEGKLTGEIDRVKGNWKLRGRVREGKGDRWRKREGVG